VKGVEFTYLRVADIVQFTESTADGVDFDHVEVLYGIDKTKGADLLSTLGLAAGAQRYENADNSDKLDSANYYYQSDVLVAALNTALETNATTVMRISSAEAIRLCMRPGNIHRTACTGGIAIWWITAEPVSAT